MSEACIKLLNRDLDLNTRVRVNDLYALITSDNLEETLKEVAKISDELDMKINKKYLKIIGSLLIVTGLGCQYLFPDLLAVNLCYLASGLSIMALGN